MFDDRADAGGKLARRLKKYKGRDVLVLAIPRGGAEVGYPVACYLRAGFSLLISRKLPYPDDPEAGFGAIAEDGSSYLVPQADLWLPEEEIARIKKEQVEEIRRRIHVLREGRPLPAISGQTVILVDDGLAVGSTMKAAVLLCRRRKAGRIVVAAPVAGGRTVREMEAMADEVVILEVPGFFQAVAQVYRHWRDLTYEDVIRVMTEWKSRGESGEC